MNIKYFGKNKECDPTAIIAHKESENELFEIIANILGQKGYKEVFSVNNDGVIDSYFPVFNKEDFNILKDIYLIVKRSGKEVFDYVR